MEKKEVKVLTSAEASAIKNSDDAFSGYVVAVTAFVDARSMITFEDTDGNTRLANSTPDQLQTAMFALQNNFKIHADLIPSEIAMMQDLSGISVYAR